MENGDICETKAGIFINETTEVINNLHFFPCTAVKTHTSTVGVYDADSQRAVLHVALEVEHRALSRCHCHVAQLSCKKTN